MLTDATTDNRLLGETDAAAVNAALAIPLPPETKMVRKSRRRSAIVLEERLAPGLAQVALAAASYLGELADDSGERVFQIAKHAPHRTAIDIFAALERAGVDTSRRWASFFADISTWVSAHKEYQADLLTDISSLCDSDGHPDDEGYWSLTDIGDLLTATGYHEIAASEFDRAFIHDSAETRRSWLDAMAAAYGIDKLAAATQARHLQQRCEQANGADTVSDDWFVVSTKPPAGPSLPAKLDAALKTEQLRTLLSCLEADSDWIAFAAADVLINVNQAPWNSMELFKKDMSRWPRRQGVRQSREVFRQVTALGAVWCGWIGPRRCGVSG